MLPFTQKGLTLLELLVTIIVFSIVTSIAVSSFQWLSERNAASTTRSHIDRAFSVARFTAVTERTVVTICPLDAANKCTNDWSLPTAVFRDPSSDLRLTHTSQLVRFITLAPRGQLSPSNSFHGARKYFQYQADGGIRGTLGHFTWCPQSGNRTSAIHVRVNFGGRLVWSRDTNDNHIVEDASGVDIGC